MDKPQRACILLAKIEADTPAAMASALERLAFEILAGELSGVSLSGGYSSGWIVDYQQSDRPTHDEYFQKLQAHLDEKRQHANKDAT